MQNVRRPTLVHLPGVCGGGDGYSAFECLSHEHLRWREAGESLRLLISIMGNFHSLGALNVSDCFAVYANRANEKPD